MEKITISGFPGSGKSTIGKKLAEHYKIPFLTVGGFRRKLALEMGLTIDEFNILGEKEKWTDTVADTFQKELGNLKSGFIFEGRLSWYFIPNSIKIFFTTKKDFAARRIFENQRKSEKKFKTPKEVEDYLTKRCKSDIKRYKKIYQIENCYEIKNQDIIINTTNLTKKQVFNETLWQIRTFRLKKFFRLN